ncbi:MAG TPA: hypothetical protein VL381_00060 [Rhodocyclaceae bacterium]|jgi:hypothetical protein|nr:hypothetical protein [Rhodocyclaceae bacterium]
MNVQTVPQPQQAAASPATQTQTTNPLASGISEEVRQVALLGYN